LWFNTSMWTEYITPLTLHETLQLLASRREKARLVAGATDLMLELERGARKNVSTLLDITRLPSLDKITLDGEGVVHIGALVTHNDVAASHLLRSGAFPLVSACWQVGAPQIRNRATVAGNLVTASPANDTITPLIALNASVRLASLRGERLVRLQDFYTGVRRTVLEPDEMLVEINFPLLKNGQAGTFLKLGLRRAQAISVVNAAVVLQMKDELIESAVITLGAVAPTIIHAATAESHLAGQRLSAESIARAGELAAQDARPIDDIRGSAAYRRAMVRTLVMRALRQIKDNSWLETVPEDPVILVAGNDPPHSPLKATAQAGAPIHTRINGKAYTFTTGQEKSLLRLLREEADLTGTKEGCAEGECGACTVFLDGKAVMACLVPAPRANGSEITTVEGLTASQDQSAEGIPLGERKLHPVQQAFIADGAVQCGYCTPGFIMSAAKLLEERPHPSRQEITQALTGNLCRCTGYYKIIQAVEDAVQ
jgi:xanthine dehydrogenase iron-sulfur cluster and FAD-binding subunit A